MAKVLIVSGPNHGFDKSAPVIADALGRADGIDVTLTDDRSILASPSRRDFDVCVLGTGFSRRERQPDGTIVNHKDLTDEQERGLFDFVRAGKGFVGIHGTGWWIGGEAIRLVGGHANWHPPGLEFGVRIVDSDHPITQGIADFSLHDEIYMSAWDPAIHVLATATWAERDHPMAWTHRYGDGRVFYTTLGHSAGTFEVPAVRSMLANAARWAAGES